MTKKLRRIKEQILDLRSQGKTYQEICDILLCSKGTVAYHCGDGQKDKVRARVKKNARNNPLVKKISCFCGKSRTFSILQHSSRTQQLTLLRKIYTFRNHRFGDHEMMNFTVEELVNKIGESPICYLSGRKIDMDKSRSYNLDHITPRSRGGNNSIENCNIIDKQVNAAKRDLTNEEFISLCKEVLEHNGFDVRRR